MKRYADHKTAAAPLSRSLAAVALAVSVICVLAGRFNLIEPDILVLSLLFTAGLSLAAIGLALVAMSRIWSLGGSGLGKALGAIVLAIVALLPPAAIIGLVIVEPDLEDVTTDRQDVPVFIVESQRDQQPFLTWFNAALADYVWPFTAGIAGQSETSLQAELYPDIVPRRYRIAPGELHAASLKASEALGWTIINELPPDLPDTPTYLQAEGTTPLMGLKRDIALRIRPDRVGALLDIRSRSQTPLRDLYGNATQVRMVFEQIDQVLLETYGDLARLTVDEEEPEEIQEADPLRGERETIPVPAFKPYFEEADDEAAPGFGADDLEG